MHHKIHFQCIVHFISRNVKKWFSRKSSGQSDILVYTWVGKKNKTKKTWKWISFHCRTPNVCFVFWGLKMLILKKKGCFQKNLASLGGGQTWCEKVQNPCLWVFYWRKLKLVWVYLWNLYVSCVHHKIWIPPTFCLNKCFQTPNYYQAESGVAVRVCSHLMSVALPCWCMYVIVHYYLQLHTTHCILRVKGLNSVLVLQSHCNYSSKVYYFT